MHKCGTIHFEISKNIKTNIVSLMNIVLGVLIFLLKNLVEGADANFQNNLLGNEICVTL